MKKKKWYLNLILRKGNNWIYKASKRISVRKERQNDKDIVQRNIKPFLQA